MSYISDSKLTTVASLLETEYLRENKEGNSGCEISENCRKTHSTCH